MKVFLAYKQQSYDDCPTLIGVFRNEAAAQAALVSPLAKTSSEHFSQNRQMRYVEPHEVRS